MSPEQIGYEFVGYSDSTPAELSGQNRLFLDVGNGLRAGVIDHHSVDHTGSTTSLVRNRPDLVQASLANPLEPGDRFTIVLHEFPDLDCVASAYLAIALLTTGNFPAGDDVLARYVDGVDEGSIGMSPSQPYSLYPAFRQLVERFGPTSSNWREFLPLGLALVEFALKEAVRTGQTLLEVDGFACPGVFGDEERTAIQEDRDRYERKLEDPATKARIARLRLPSQFEGTVEVEALLVRDVQNEDDPKRCLYFKEWARNDEKRCPNRRGFEALSVSRAENTLQHRSCTISVTPRSLSSLRGLGGLLEGAETVRRNELYGMDDRVCDTVTDTAKPREEGSENADPWYDGRSHRYTIVEAPRSGTELTADEVEAGFLQFGDAGETVRRLA